MKELTKKFIVQSIIIWSVKVIFNIISMILYKDYLVKSLALIINTYLLVDSILALKKLKKFVVIDFSMRR